MLICTPSYPPPPPFPVGLTLKHILFFFCLGIVSTSPLRLELVFEPVPDITWFLVYTFVYTNKIQFSGSRMKQDVSVDMLK
jgi:hypothetical protein